MLKNKVNKKCVNCDNVFQTLDPRTKFCSKSCSSKYNNSGGRKNPISEDTKIKISVSMKLFRKNNPLTEEEKNVRKLGAINAAKGKNENPETILKLSKRTVSKIFNRLGVGCSFCGWDETICDIHHINGRKIKNADSHENLTYLCPNCHRKCHKGLIEKEQLINLQVFIGDKWKEFYYG